MISFFLVVFCSWGFNFDFDFCAMRWHTHEFENCDLNHWHNSVMNKLSTDAVFINNVNWNSISRNKWKFWGCDKMRILSSSNMALFFTQMIPHLFFVWHIFGAIQNKKRNYVFNFKWFTFPYENYVGNCREASLYSAARCLCFL